MAVLRVLVGFIVTGIIVVFAVLNRADVSVFLSPVHDSVTMPIYVVSFVFMASGFVFGMIITWLNMSGVRKEKRRQRKEIKILQKEIEGLKKSGCDSNPPIDVDILQALPVK